jgi:hypothetical protein
MHSPRKAQKYGQLFPNVMGFPPPVFQLPKMGLQRSQNTSDNDLEVPAEVGFSSPNDQSQRILWDCDMLNASHAMSAINSQQCVPPATNPFQTGGEPSDTSMPDAGMSSRSVRTGQSGSSGNGLDYWARESEGSYYSEMAALDDDEALSFMLQPPVNTPASKKSETSTAESSTPAARGGTAGLPLQLPMNPRGQPLCHPFFQGFQAPHYFPETPPGPSRFSLDGQCGQGPIATPDLSQNILLPATNDIKSRKEALYGSRSNFAMPDPTRSGMRHGSHPGLPAPEKEWFRRPQHRVFSHSYVNSELPMSPTESWHAGRFETGSQVSSSDCFPQSMENNVGLTDLTPLTSFRTQSSGDVVRKELAAATSQAEPDGGASLNRD